MTKVLACLFCVFLPTVFAANIPQLQRGAGIFMDYCSGCHSLGYLTYQRINEDLAISAFPGRPGAKGPVVTALANQDAQNWFGVIPPDLSLKAREKGAQWLREYLDGFYPDKSRPFAVNNYLVPDLAMPNVLATIPAEQYEQTLNELIAFLAYAAEPVEIQRYRMGIVVLIFLAVLAVLSYFLKKSTGPNR